jgi:hypothetical protein
MLAGAILATLLATSGLLILTSSVVQSLGQISADKPQIARLLGYQLSEDNLSLSVEGISAKLAELSFAASNGSQQTGAALQKTLRDYAEETGLVVVGSRLEARPLSSADDDDNEDATANFERLVVELNVHGVPLAIDAFLSLISVHVPKLTITELEIQPQRRQSRQQGRAEPGSLSLQLRVAGLRAMNP